MLSNINKKGLLLLKLASIALLIAFVSASNTEAVSRETVMDLALLYILFKVAFYTRLLTMKMEEKVVQLQPFFYMWTFKVLSYVYPTPNTK